MTHPFLFTCYVNSALCYFVLADQFIKFPDVPLFFLLNQKISYMNFDEAFLQDGTPQVLWTLKSHTPS